VPVTVAQIAEKAGVSESTLYRATTNAKVPTPSTKPRLQAAHVVVRLRSLIRDAVGAGVDRGYLAEILQNEATKLVRAQP
jgi:AcrR family transcriptional regulator